MNAYAPIADRLAELWRLHRDEPHLIDIASLLPPPGDAARTSALHEVVPLDLAARWQNGVPVSLEDYIQRFPELGPIERVPPMLIAEEYRIRARYGVVTPQSVLKQRFPGQWNEVEKILGGSSPEMAKTIIPSVFLPKYLSSGQVIGGHLQLNRLIGRGGFGEVWHATDLRGQIDKAVKVLTRSADSEEAKKELESLNIIKKINHPCLVRTESYFVEEDRLFIVLELADATLRDVLKKSQTESRTGIPVESLLTHIRHAAEGLDHLHKQGILHRDVKPENILVIGDYGKVADFGLAKSATNKHSTQADFAGTVVYSAPETWDGRVTTRSDQYSLAATYFELRTGRVLFGGKTFQEVFGKHMQAHTDLSPLPDLEQDVLRQALAKKPEDRFATCVEFVKELTAAVLASGSKTVASDPPSGGAHASTPRGQARTVERHAKKTAEAEALSPNIDLSVRPHGSKDRPDSGPRKWNEGTARPRRLEGRRSWVVPTVGMVFLVAASAAGYIAFTNDVFKTRPQTSNEPIAAAVSPPAEKIVTPPEPAIKPTPPNVKPPENKDPEVKPSVPKNEPPVKPLPPEVKPETKPELKIPPTVSAARKALIAAKAQFDAGDNNAARAALLAMKLPSEPDTDVRREGLVLLAKLLETAPLAELRKIDTALSENPLVKPAFAAVMTSRLIDEGPQWLETKNDWKERVRDCERAEPTAMIRALQAEASLESGVAWTEPLPPAGDGQPFLTYVRARLLDSQGESPKAAAAILSLPSDAKELEGPRALRSALILQKAALRLTPEKDGKLTPFATIADADRAFAWHTRALALLGDPPLDDPSTLPPKDRINYALAAAFKTTPDFDLGRRIGECQITDRPGLPAIPLVLSQPTAFSGALAKLLPKIQSNDVAPWMALGREQLKAAPDNPALRNRQAALAEVIVLRGDPNTTAYKVASARRTIADVLADLKDQGETPETIKKCKDALAAADDAWKLNASEDERWADFSLRRAQLAVAIGRMQDHTSPASRAAFEKAVAAAKIPSAPQLPKGEPSLTLAQAYEGLAYLSRTDVEKNFDAAILAYKAAAADQPAYNFQLGRCLYRWAMDADLKYARAKRDPLLTAAVEAFERLKADDPAATIPESEARYWEALANWDRIARVTPSPKAQKAFDRSLKAAAEGHGDPEWAGFALKGLVDMTRLQVKNSPEMSLGWLKSVQPACKTLAAELKDDPFASAHREYRDLMADTAMDLASQYLKANNYAKYRAFLDQAFETKHSTKEAPIAVARAVGYKKHEAKMGVTATELVDVRRDAETAIDTAPNLTPPARQLLRRDLESGWK